MNIVGRSYMLITTGSERVNRIGGHTHLNDFNFKTIFLNKILLKYIKAHDF